MIASNREGPTDLTCARRLVDEPLRSLITDHSFFLISDHPDHRSPTLITNHRPRSPAPFPQQHLDSERFFEQRAFLTQRELSRATSWTLGAVITSWLSSRTQRISWMRPLWE